MEGSYHIKCNSTWLNFFLPWQREGPTERMKNQPQFIIVSASVLRISSICYPPQISEIKSRGNKKKLYHSSTEATSARNSFERTRLDLYNCQTCTGTRDGWCPTREAETKTSKQPNRTKGSKLGKHPLLYLCSPVVGRSCIYGNKRLKQISLRR